MRDALRLGAILIGTYLVVYYATGAGKVIGSAGTAVPGVIRAFQGR